MSDTLTVTVTTRATATIEETWVLRLSPAKLRAARREPGAILDYLAAEDVEVVSVTDKVVGDEEDREVLSIEPAA